MNGDDEPAGPLPVKRQEPLQDGLVRDRSGVFVGGPAVGGSDGAVEGGVGVGEPDGAGVVEVGEGEFFELVGGGALGVEPAAALDVEVLGGGEQTATATRYGATRARRCRPPESGRRWGKT